ncbi:MAG: hypothetical protein ACOVVK_21260 [Elsteraceae bacterium]
MSIHDEQGTIRRYIQSTLDWAYERQLSAEIDSDFRAFDRAQRSLDGGYRENFNPAFDYRYNRLDWSNAVYLHFVDENGRIVGQVAAKLLPEMSSLYEIYESERFWFCNRRPPGDPIVEMLSDGTKQLTGLMSTSGSLWVARDWRKTGLSRRLAMMARAMMMKNFPVVRHTTMVKQALYEAGMAQTYQHTHAELSLRLTNFGYDMHTLWTEREQALELFSRVEVRAPAALAA